MADDRLPAKVAADDALAKQAEITITPELWLKGVKQDAVKFGFPPYTLKKRAFAAVDEAAAMAGYDALCATGMSPEKAWRIYLSETGPTADDIRLLLDKRLGLP